MTTKTLLLPEIGEVKLQKSRRNKYINLKVKSSGVVKVSLPRHASFKDAESFVREKQGWIKMTLEKIKSKVGKPELITQKTNYKTRKHRLEFHAGKRLQCRLDDGVINFYCPENEYIESEFAQKCIRKSIDKALKLEAEEYLPGRLDYWSKKTGLKYNGLKLNNAKRHWGMCMGDNLIKLNIQLMKIPNEFIDYVILHELAHIKEKNHSPKFYAVLEKLIPNPKDWRKKMKIYSPDKYLY